MDKTKFIPNIFITEKHRDTRFKKAMLLTKITNQRIKTISFTEKSSNYFIFLASSIEQSN